MSGGGGETERSSALRGRDPSVLSRGGDEGPVVCARCVTLPAYRGFGAREETERKGAGRDAKEGRRRREGDDDWNKIFTVAAGAGP